MSEINSIANGTYTIGQTSATNFVAGPGIKIDEPSAGTVRIGTDETVLYDDTVKASISNTEIFTMSESIWNFERLILTFDNMEFTNRLHFMDIDLTKCNTSTIFRTSWDNAEDPLTLNIVWARFNINTSGNIVYVKKGLIYGTWSSPQVTTGNSRGLCLIRVVGINRISGGNE